MLSQSVFVDPNTGGYVAINGQLQQQLSIINKVNLLLRQKIGQNIYDTASGNLLLDTQGRLTPSQISNNINFCLASLLNTGEISTLNIENVKYSPTGKLNVAIGITLPNGVSEIVNWTR
jgi:hypothetical protein